jgi:hypothetical protein
MDVTGQEEGHLIRSQALAVSKFSTVSYRLDPQDPARKLHVAQGSLN